MKISSFASTPTSSRQAAPAAEQPAPAGPSDSYKRSKLLHTAKGVLMGAVPLYGTYNFGKACLISGVMGSPSQATKAGLGAAANLAGSVALMCGLYPQGAAALAVAGALSVPANLGYLD